MTRPVSDSMMRLFLQVEALRERAVLSDREIERASLEEATALADYEEAYAKAFLGAVGTNPERVCVAKLAHMDLFRNLQISIALRRSASAATRTLHQDYETVQALAHAYNRELRAGS